MLIRALSVTFSISFKFEQGIKATVNFKMAKVVEERDGLILSLSWHPSGDYLAVVGSDGALKVWQMNVTPYKLIFEKVRERSVRRVEWSPSGTRLVTAGFDSVAVVYRFTNETPPFTEQMTLKEHSNELKTCRWSKDEKYLVTTSRDKLVCVWEVDSTDDPLNAVHSGHTADVKDAAFSSDATMLASVSFDGTLKLWDTESEISAVQSFSDHKGTVWSLAFNPKNDDIVTIGEDGKAILYSKSDDVYDKVRELELQKPGEPLYSIVYSGDGWIIAGSERKIFFVDEDLESVVKEIKSPQIGDVNCVALCPTNRGILAAGSDDGTVILLEC